MTDDRENTPTDETPPTGPDPKGASNWQQYIEPFASAIGKSVDEVTEALKGVAGEAGDDAIEVLGNEDYASFDDLKAALGDVPVGRLKKAVSQHLRAKPAESEVTDAEQAATLVTPTFEMLPQVPEDDAWLQMLKTGGELKVDKTTVISAIRAALAERSGLYDLPKEIVAKMETQAESLEEPVGDNFFKLRKMLTTRSYAEIFAALDVDGQFVSQKRKDQFLARLDDSLWAELVSFNGQLKSWADSWQQGMANPAAMMGALMTMSQGAAGAAMPPGMMQPPPTDGLRDSADAFKDQVNRVFAGVGIPVARALAYDALRVKEVLQDPTLPAQVGAVNRDQMLKMLGANVSADYVRLERNLTRFTLAVIEYTDSTAGQEELAYLSALLMLGMQIPFDKLGVRTGNIAVQPRRRKRNTSAEGTDEDLE